MLHRRPVAERQSPDASRPCSQTAAQALRTVLQICNLRSKDMRYGGSSTDCVGSNVRYTTGSKNPVVITQSSPTQDSSFSFSWKTIDGTGKSK